MRRRFNEEPITPAPVVRTETSGIREELAALRRELTPKPVMASAAHGGIGDFFHLKFSPDSLLWGFGGFAGAHVITQMVEQTALGAYGPVVIQAVPVGLIALGTYLFGIPREAKKWLLIGAGLKAITYFVQKYYLDRIQQTYEIGQKVEVANPPDSSFPKVPVDMGLFDNEELYS